MYIQVFRSKQAVVVAVEQIAMQWPISSMKIMEGVRTCSYSTRLFATLAPTMSAPMQNCKLSNTHTHTGPHCFGCIYRL